MYVCTTYVHTLTVTLTQHSAHLLPHWFWVGDSCAEEPVPLQTAIQPCPVVVAVASVRQAPRDESVVLAVGGVTPLSLSTAAHAPQPSLT